MDKSSKKQINSSTDGSNSQEATAGSSRQLAVADINAELTKISRTLIQLEFEHIICNQQIDNNLKRRENLVQQICLLISTLEKTLMFYDQALNARRNLEDTLGANSFDIDNVDSETDEDSELQEIVENIYELQEDVVRTERQVDFIRRMCAHVEPHFKFQMNENETIHAKLCEKIGKIERSRQEAIARRKQLLKMKNSIKAEKS